MEPLNDNANKQLLELIRNDESISNKYRRIDDILKYETWCLLKTEVHYQFVSEFHATIEKTFHFNEEIVQKSGHHLPSDAKVLVKSHFKLLATSLSLFKEQLSSLLTQAQFDTFLQLQVLVCKLIFAVYAQCKHWKALYSSHVTNFTELLNIFKLTQDVQLDCLLLLEKRIQPNQINPCNQDCLVQLCDILCNTGDLLFSINTKSMLSTWRCYLSVIKVNAKLQTVKPIRILFHGIIGCIQKEDDELNFKITSFLFRIVKCIHSLTSEQTNRNLFDFFMQICNLYEFIGSGRELFWTDVNELVTNILIDEKLFVGELRLCNTIGLTNVTKVLLLKSNMNIHIGRTHAFLKYFLYNLNADAYGYLRNGDQYDTILIDFIAVILGVDAREYVDIEECLLKYILNGNVWQLTFAYDVWILILRIVPPQLSMDTLRSLVEKVPSNTVFKSNTCYIFVKSILSQSYNASPKYAQTQFLDTILLNKEIHKIAICDINLLLSENKCFFTDILDSLKHSLDAFPAQDAEFIYLMDSVSVLSNFLTHGYDNQAMQKFKDLSSGVQNKLSKLVTKLCRINEHTLSCKLYGRLLTNAHLPMLLVLIANLQINNAQLLKILSDLKAHAHHSFSQLFAAVIIEHVVRQSPDEYNLFIQQIVLQYFATWQSPIESPIVQQYVDAARMRFNANTAWLKAARNPCGHGNNRKRKFQNDSTTMKEEQGEDDDATTCIAAQDILDHMKDEIKQLKKLATNGKWAKVTKTNTKDIFLIVDTLKNFV